jgi:secreted Zn-dependent insulinase-like peptidase
VHLHFQSKNTEEQNGAVLITYQSATPSFKGSGLSKPESLVQSAAVRTICHMLKEPLFNQLRTKEQLGYIVSSYYGKSASLHSDMSVADSDLATTTTIDSIVINVLSKKVPPPVVRKRIDEFLSTFRAKLE